MSAPVILPRVVLTRFLAAGWDLTRLMGRFAAADRASISRPPLSSAPTAKARGRCLIRRRPLATLPDRRLAGMGATCCGPSSSPGERDGTLSHLLHGVGRDGCYCEVLCLRAIKTRSDGRLSLAGPGGTPGGDSETTPDKRRPRAPTRAARPPRRLPYVGRETFGAVLAPYGHLEPGNLYEALHSMRRVCSCSPVWVRYYHEDMGWGPFVDRPCVCGCPWRHGEYVQA